MYTMYLYCMCVYIYTYIYIYLKVLSPKLYFRTSDLPSLRSSSKYSSSQWNAKAQLLAFLGRMCRLLLPIFVFRPPKP